MIDIQDQIVETGGSGSGSCDYEDDCKGESSDTSPSRSRNTKADATGPAAAAAVTAAVAAAADADANANANADADANANANATEIQPATPLPSCPFDSLCDDELARVASYCDFASAVRFLRCVSGRIRRRVLGFGVGNDILRLDGLLGAADGSLLRRAGEKEEMKPNHVRGLWDVRTGGSSSPLSAAAFDRLWREMYVRQRFAPPDPKDRDGSDDGKRGGGRPFVAGVSFIAVDYVSECRRRRDLFRNLVGRSRASQPRREGRGEAGGRGAGKRLDALFASSSPTSSSSPPSLSSPSSCTQPSAPFGSLPNRYFHFVPLTPSIDDRDHEQDAFDDEWDWGLDNDPPPVEFACESYALLSTGTGTRMVLMDPFDGSISVRRNVLDNAVASEEAMLEQAMAGAASAVLSSRSRREMMSGAEGGGDLVRNDHGELGHGEEVDKPDLIGHDDDDDDDDDDSAQAGGAAMEEAIIRNHNLGPGIPPERILFGVDDYFSIDLSEYFRVRGVEMGGNGWGGAAPRAQQDPIGLAMEVTRHVRGNGRGGNGFGDGDEDDNGDIGIGDEITVDWLGVSCHTSIDSTDWSVLSTLVGAARILTNDITAARTEDERVCSEVIGWKGDPSGSMFPVRYATRISGFPNYMDIDAVHDRVYATFAPGEGPFLEDGTDGSVAHRFRNAQPRANVRIENGQGEGDDLEEEEEEEEEEELLGDVDWNGNRIRRSRCVARYPFVPVEKDPRRPTAAAELFPTAESALWASRPVSCFIVDPTGRRILLGTDGGAAEVWDTGLPGVAVGDNTAPAIGRSSATARPRRVQTCDMSASLAAAGRLIQRKRKYGIAGVRPSREVENGEAIPDGVGDQERNLVVSERNAPVNCLIVDRNDDSDAALSRRALSQCKPTHRVESIFLPRHLPVETCGFVTLQHHRSEGTTLGLWQKPTLGVDCSEKDERYELVAIINLPLSPQRKPQVSYDGRRLVVFGQDHIGLIVLVYHVMSTREDQPWFEGAAELQSSTGIASKNSRLRGRGIGGDGGADATSGRVRSGSFGDASGGVLNLLNGGAEVRVQYANRVRHAGLGGLEYYDPAFMTCNERFVVVNTKMGNLVGGDGGRVRGACEGLFVIDLEEKHL